ncbi:MAG: hypothetical protein M3406_09180, partial [Chloroflexota bacterium]|nr:hypothetical protein [Chloroflexota bacterium]
MSTDRQRVIFVCTHNSARSQMAEGMLRTWGGNRREACPTIPVVAHQAHWSIDDPSATEGDEEARLKAFRMAAIRCGAGSR